MFDQIRTRIGAFVVQLGVRIIGVDPDKFGRALPSEKDDDLDDDGDEMHSPVFMPVELNEEARKMVYDGLTAVAPTRPPKVSNVLAGSARARIDDERRKVQEAMRPRKG